MRDLLPAAIFASHKMFDLSSVAIAHRSKHGVAIFRCAERDLGYAGKVLADFVAIVRQSCAQLVEVDLLIEAQVLFGTLSLPRIARVVEAGAVRVPGHAAAGGSSIDARNRISGFLATCHVIQMDRSVFTAAGRK